MREGRHDNSAEETSGRVRESVPALVPNRPRQSGEPQSSL